MKNYSEEDLKKLESVLVGFEKLENKLGDTVSVDFRTEFRYLRYKTSMLYSVRRFIGIEAKPDYDDKIYLIPFTSVNKGIVKIEDLESNTLYTNQNETLEEIFKNNPKWQEHKKMMDSYQANPFSNRKLVESEKRLLWYIDGSSQKRRRELFGNIIADIEERYLHNNGQELFTYGSNDDESYISMLEIYDKQLPKGYSVFSNADNQPKK